MSDGSAVPSLLTVNAGSSSLRLALFADPAEAPLAQEHLAPAPAPDADVLWRLVRGAGGLLPRAVVHRVVHGGHRLRSPCVVDAAVEAEIARLGSLAPLHNPVALGWIRAARALGVPQIAVFDTAFFADLPDQAANCPLPADVCDRLGIRRYGFHGLAHRSMLEQWRARVPGAAPGARVISLQLGAGCSVTASLGGRPVETSMGFSPLEGLMMTTRCGDVDPAVVLRLARDGSFSIEEIDWMLNHASGLSGVAGSGDMAELLGREDAAARLAVDMFCHRARKYIGAYLAVLGGLDVIIFGGGIAERAPSIRARLLDGVSWAGILLDPARNGAVEPGVVTAVSAAGSPAAAWVVPVDEAGIMARDAARLLDAGQAGP